jgi:endonuclease/exonuclease/phosphatase (EEP) superfamily protein YafD
MQGLFKLAVWLLFLLTGLGFLGQIHWVFELIAPFRLQFFALFVVATLGYGTVGDRQLFFAAFMGAIINGWLVLPVFFAQPVIDATQPTHAITLVQMNLSTRNIQHQRAVRTMLDLQADVVALEEVSALWRQALAESAALQQRLPYHYHAVNSQTSIYSRYPLGQVAVHKTGSGYPVDNVLTASVQVPNAPFTLMVAHPPHPTSAMENWRQLVMFTYLIANKRQWPSPFVLAGDLNTTPWSHHYQALLRQMTLQDSRAGFGVNPTWPERLWPLRIPIDHVLVSKDIAVLDTQVGMATGSDHLPLVVKLALPKKR